MEIETVTAFLMLSVFNANVAFFCMEVLGVEIKSVTKITGLAGGVFRSVK